MDVALNNLGLEFEGILPAAFPTRKKRAGGVLVGGIILMMGFACHDSSEQGCCY